MPDTLPPYFDLEVTQKMRWRDGDIVVNAGAKAGTHWAMNIVYQLLSGGDETFESLYEEVPWLEFKEYPGQKAEERIQRWENMEGRRAFKSHLPSSLMPIQPNVKYLVVCREGKEVVNSYLPFINNHTDEFRRLWNTPLKFSSFDEVLDFFEKSRIYHRFCTSWWTQRHHENVLLLHYADLKRDLEGNVRKIAKFLEIPIDESRFAKIVEYNSFKWMADHDDQIQGMPRVRVPVLAKKTIMRQGKVESFSSNFTSEHHARWDRFTEQQFPDPIMRAWMKSGGPLPQEQQHVDVAPAPA